MPPSLRLLCEDAAAAALVARAGGGGATAAAAGEADAALAAALGLPAPLALDVPGDGFWRAGVVVARARASQYDALRAALAAGAPLPTPLFALALGGDGFHGQRGRPWAAAPGNLHLCVALRPDDLLAARAPLLMALPAVAAAEAVEALAGGALAPGVKWVNDLLLDGRKIGGVLAASQALDGRVGWAVLGIGLNVAVAPPLPPTPFVPATGALAPACAAAGLPPPSLRDALLALLDALAARWRAWQREGPDALLAAYRARSLVLGRAVTVHPDPGEGSAAAAPLRGVAIAIDDDLALRLRDRAEPVREGRLVLG